MTAPPETGARCRVIAIDGPAASGKGTLADRIAAHYGFARLDSGRLYRAVAKRLMDGGGDGGDGRVCNQEIPLGADLVGQHDIVAVEPAYEAAPGALDQPVARAGNALVALRAGETDAAVTGG